MDRRTFLGAASATSLAALAGCSGSDGDDGSTDFKSEPEDAEIGATVVMEGGREFVDLKVEVAEGEAVEWRNESGSSREIRTNEAVDGAAEWDPILEVDLEDGESAWYTFEESGVYSYHEQTYTRGMMCGAVAVGDSSADDIAELPCE